MKPIHSKRSLMDVSREALVHAVRPESKHEAKKLLERSFFMYLMLFPVNLVGNLILFRKAPISWSNADFRKELKRSTQSAAWTSVMYPVVGQYLMTFVREMAQAGEHLNKMAAQDAGNVLAGAILGAARHDASLHETFEQAAKGSFSGVLLTDENDARRAAAIAASPSASPHQLRELAGLYDKMAAQMSREAQKLASPFQNGKTTDDSLHAALKRIVAQPIINNAADAALALNFVRVLLQMNAEYVGVLRFFEPHYQQLPTKLLGEVSKSILDIAASLNLALPGQRYLLDNGREVTPPVPPDIHPHELVHMREQDQALSAMTETQLLQLANNVMRQMKQQVTQGTLLQAVDGYYLEKAVGGPKSYAAETSRSLLNLVNEAETPSRNWAQTTPRNNSILQK